MRKLFLAHTVFLILCFICWYWDVGPRSSTFSALTFTAFTTWPFWVFWYSAGISRWILAPFTLGIPAMSLLLGGALVITSLARDAYQRVVIAGQQLSIRETIEDEIKSFRSPVKINWARSEIVFRGSKGSRSFRIESESRPAVKSGAKTGLLQ